MNVPYTLGFSAVMVLLLYGFPLKLMIAEPTVRYSICAGAAVIVSISFLVQLVLPSVCIPLLAAMALFSACSSAGHAIGKGFGMSERESWDLD